MSVEEKSDICMSCGRTIGSNERAAVVEGGVICFQCEKKLPAVPESVKMPVAPEKVPITQNQTREPATLERILKIVFICSPLLCLGSMLVSDALLVWRGVKPVGFIGTTALYTPNSVPKSVDIKEMNIGLVAVIAGLCLTLWLARVRNKDNMRWIDKCWWYAAIIFLVAALLLGVGIGYVLGWMVLVVLVSLVFVTLRTENFSEKWFWVSVVSVFLYVCIGLMFRYEIKQPRWFTSNHEVESIEGNKALIRDRYGSAGQRVFLIPSSSEN